MLICTLHTGPRITQWNEVILKDTDKFDGSAQGITGTQKEVIDITPRLHNTY